MRGITRFSGIMAFIETADSESDIAGKVAELRDAAMLGSEGVEFNNLIENIITKDEQHEGEFSWAGSP